MKLEESRLLSDESILINASTLLEQLRVSSLPRAHTFEGRARNRLRARG